MRVVSLAVHPVKSTAIRPVEKASVTRAGLAGDREWMVVNDFGELISAREFPPLFSVVADNAATGLAQVALRLSAPGIEPLTVDLPHDGEECSVRMFTRPPMTARAAGTQADAWLDRALGTQGFHLVWCSNPTARHLNPEFSRPDDHAAFQDGYPVTLLSTASVARLQDWVTEHAVERGEDAATIGSDRFRSNILIDGVPEAFAEDGWSGVRIADVDFRVAKRVDRCVMTTIDPQTYRTAKEPIRTLAQHRRSDGKTWMAIALIPDSEGEISLGDEVIPHT
ncbi:MOSC N-terminal beta barrel domain-containing protein [Yimella sp. NH-Cas1]|uniref:MOSC domain-containing protein n=1 Tax=Yimella sp. NH-Cas1 TaxID=2917726 RepID=UPI001EFB9191|nr:MOSC N-terminal beta barrel domain-containing protein [Yimella sp. NH-Cas1]MCG8656086.1 MOSC domain-containing protein [Yimella sp. NH-Cas1]